MIRALFDGIHATVRANAHGGIELDANDVPALQRELGAAHVRALALRAEHDGQAQVYAHA
jgi:hypothetical protein